MTFAFTTPRRFIRRTGEQIMATLPATALSGPDKLEIARQQVLASDFFGLCYLMLCNLAYADENDGPKAVQQIKQSLPRMPVPAGTVAGKWNLGWGPQVSRDNGNLMYAAEFQDLESGKPVFSAVVIRGTDTQAKPSGILQQLVEDVGAEKQVLFPDNNLDGAKIALGTKIGLDVLNGFTDAGNETVEQYLNGFLKTNPAAPVVVTGHSLGGCQTTVMAKYLSKALPPEPKIVPNSFAAPTAGNSAFIQLYEQAFPFAPRWFNSMDLVPMAFAGLGGIKQLWNACNRPAPEGLKIVIDAIEVLLRGAKASYSQQSPGNSRALVGACQSSAADAVPAGRQIQAVADIQALLQRVAGRLPIPPIPAILFNKIDDWVRELLFQHLILTGYWDSVKSSHGVAAIPNPF
jgi:hypothetical protein